MLVLKYAAQKKTWILLAALSPNTPPLSGNTITIGVLIDSGSTRDLIPV